MEEWRAKQISTVTAKLIIYQAFVESESDTPRRAGGLMSWAASKAVGRWV